MKKRCLSLVLASALCLSLACTAFASEGGHWDFDDPSNGPQWVEDTSGTDTPGTDTPGTDTPGTDTPGTDTPGTDTPGTDTPGTDTPDKPDRPDTPDYPSNSGSPSPGGTSSNSSGSSGSTTPSTPDKPDKPDTSDTPSTPSTPSASGSVSFKDVTSGAYYYDAVQWAVAQGITNGTGTDTFSPDAPCTRGQIVTFLWRAAGSPISYGSSQFTDVQVGDYYFNAVRWAVEKGITNGTGANTFSPDETCTRAQAVTFLYRYGGSPAMGGAGSFSDVAGSAYYANAVKWAVDNQITNGTSTSTFSPDDICTRGHIVTFMYRDLAD